MRTKHTPGPWWVTEEDTFGMGCRAVECDFGDPVCHVETWMDDDVVHPQALANALLIAAAPDLLLALEMAVRALRQHDIDEEMAGEFEVLTDAISKANGE